MPRAAWNGAVLAETEQTVVLEGNHYFPPGTVNSEYLRPSETQSVCPWKGTASYYHVEVEGQVLTDAAWYYPEPKPEAAEIRNHVAFWKDVAVSE